MHAFLWLAFVVLHLFVVTLHLCSRSVCLCSHFASLKLLCFCLESFCFASLCVPFSIIIGWNVKSTIIYIYIYILYYMSYTVVHIYIHINSYFSFLQVQHQVTELYVKPLNIHYIKQEEEYRQFFQVLFIFSSDCISENFSVDVCWCVFHLQTNHDVHYGCKLI